MMQFWEKEEDAEVEMRGEVERWRQELGCRRTRSSVPCKNGPLQMYLCPTESDGILQSSLFHGSITFRSISIRLFPRCL